MAHKKDYYAILGISRNASPEEIRQAYFDAARRLHPDKNVAPGETELFIEVQEAYETLANPKKRAKYDATLPPEQPVQIPIETRILYSRQNLLPLQESQLVYVLLELAPRPDVPPPPAPPLNLCLVIDHSTSMQGKNIEVVKDTAIQIMRRLRPEDYFSLVIFNDKAEVIIPSQSGADVKRMESRIHMIQCAGGTEIFSGLETGYKELLRYMRRSSATHLILLTDGRTYGDEEKCIELARKAAEQNITIRGLGIGADWNDVFLDEISSLTGGNSMYISRPEDIQRILMDEINRLSTVYAQETTLEFKIPADIELRYLFRIKPDPTLLSSTDSIKLGPVIQHASIQVLMEFVVHQARENQVLTLLEGKIGFTLPHPKTKNISLLLKLNRPVKNELDAEPPPAEIVNALSKLILYRLQEQARQEAQAGDFEHAAEHLQYLATHLLARGERELAKTALLEADHLRRQGDFSKVGIKEIKYGTRALLTAGERK